MKNNTSPILKNKNGSTVLLVLGISAIMAVGVTFLTDRIENQRKLSANLNSNISYTIAIQSVTDYAKLALKNKWCFNTSGIGSNFVQDDGLTCASNYTHPKSIIRLMLPLKFAKKIIEYKNNPQIAPLLNITLPAAASTATDLEKAQLMKLNTFQVDGLVSDLDTTHPLKTIMSNIKGSQLVTSIRIKYEIVETINLPSNGDEVYIKITTALLDENNQVIQNGVFKASETDLIYVAPRELNYFSLVLGGSLILNKSGSNDNNTNDGDGFVPAATANAKGLSFYGPVFIQKNLVLPKAQDDKSPTTFYESVVFGSGFVAQSQQSSGTSGPLNNNGFKSPTALGVNTEWADTNLFGGFLKGFETDSGEDAGLTNLKGSANVASTSNALTLHCINKIRESTAIEQTLDSQLFAELKSPGPTFANSGEVIRTYRVAFLKNTVNGLQKRFNRQINNPVTGIDPLIRTGNVGLGLASDTTSTITAAIPDAATLTNPTVSIMVDIGFKEKNRLYIPVPDGTAANPGKTIITLKKSDSDVTPTLVTILVQDVIVNSLAQPHMRDVTIKVNAVENLIDTGAPITKWPIEYIKITGMDNTCRFGQCLPSPKGSSNYKNFYLKRFTDFENDSAVSPLPTLCQPNKIYKQISYAATAPDPQCKPNSDITLPPTGFQFPSNTDDIRTNDQLCESSGSTSLANFSSGNFEMFFTNHTSDGWELTPDLNPTIDSNGLKVYKNITFSNYNSTVATSASIYNRCLVPSIVQRVVGHFMCKKLIIESRSAPLQMIGTFIVIDKMYIHPTAMVQGIDFYSIHTPAAVAILKSAQVLKTSDGSSCNTLPTPHWHPDPGLKTSSDKYTCSPLSTLKNGSPEKFPLRWTAVTADCVRFPDANAPETTCIKKVRNYFYKSLERQYVR